MTDKQALTELHRRLTEVDRFIRMVGMSPSLGGQILENVKPAIANIERAVILSEGLAAKDGWPDWMPEETRLIFKKALDVWQDRTGYRGNGVENIDVYSRLMASICKPFEESPAHRLSFYQNIGPLALLMSKVQRIMTEKHQDDPYIDAINYLLLCHASRTLNERRNQQVNSDAPNREADQSHGFPG
jgi:hypothetical protein